MEYTWTGAIDGDLNKAGNYSPEDIPTVDDTLVISGGDNEVTVGVSNAGTVTVRNTGLSGGTFNGNIDIQDTETGSPTYTITGCTFNGTVSMLLVQTSANIFNGDYTFNYILDNGGDSQYNGRLRMPESPWFSRTVPHTGLGLGL